MKRDHIELLEIKKKKTEIQNSRDIFDTEENQPETDQKKINHILFPQMLAFIRELPNAMEVKLLS